MKLEAGCLLTGYGFTECRTSKGTRVEPRGQTTKAGNFMAALLRCLVLETMKTK